jgi:PKHD-type hydroxylase
MDTETDLAGDDRLLAHDPCHHLSVELFTLEECNRIIASARGSLRGQGEVEINDQWTVNWLVRKTSVVWLADEGDNHWIFLRIAEAVAILNGERWQFNLSRIPDLQYSEYRRGGHYVWHTDVGPGPNSTRKLSFSIQLTPSHKYLGGKLQFHRGNYTLSAEKVPGTFTIFPSFLLHRVTPVLLGQRVALVGWVHGPSPLA